IHGTMMNHLDHMAGDIALQEVLGPNPDSAMRQLKKLAGDTGAPWHVMHAIDTNYAVVTGRSNQVENRLMANIGQATRNLLTASQLGSSMISSLTDPVTAAMTARFNGISAMRVISHWLKVASSPEEKTFAVRLGLGGEAWASGAQAAIRYGELTSGGVTSHLSEAVMRANGLAPWTYAGGWAMGLELSSFVADNTAKEFKELPPL